MNIAIITGGESGEREVSINSAKNIASLIGFAETKTFVFPEDTTNFIDQRSNFDLALPIVHGAGGEDGVLQEFLHELQMPFIFSGADAHRIGIDKHLTKVIAQELNVTVPQQFFENNLLFPLFAKPRAGGSSLASQTCETREELNQLLDSNAGTEFIFEQPILGREFTVGVIERSGQALALPVIEIISKSGFFDYKSKYDPENLAEEVCPANIDVVLAEELMATALKIHQKCGIRHMSRSDFILGPDGKVYFLEINTIPGLTKTSLVPKMLFAANIKLEDLLQEWVMETVK